MRRKIACTLGCIMLVSSLVACGGNSNKSGVIKDEEILKRGELSFAGVSQEEYKNITISVLGIPDEIPQPLEGNPTEETPPEDRPPKGEPPKDTPPKIEETILYDDLNTMVAAFDSGKIVTMGLPAMTAEYLVSKNNTYTIRQVPNANIIPYSMMLKADKSKLRDSINTAIEKIHERDGIGELIRNMKNLQSVEFEHFDGAETIRFAVTGDLPPMDYVSADGKAMGFNVNLIAEICKEMKVNAEIIQINTGSRAMALASDKVDVVFWTKGEFDNSFLDRLKKGAPVQNSELDKTEIPANPIFMEEGNINIDLINMSNSLNKMDQPENTILTTPYYIETYVNVDKK